MNGLGKLCQRDLLNQVGLPPLPPADVISAWYAGGEGLPALPAFQTAKRAVFAAPTKKDVKDAKASVLVAEASPVAAAPARTPAAADDGLSALVLATFSEADTLAMLLEAEPLSVPAPDEAGG